MSWTSPGAHPASYIQWAPGGSFPGVKQLGHEVDYSSPFSAQVRNGWSFASTPPLCLYGTDRDSFTLFMYYNWCWRKKSHWLSPLQVLETVMLPPWQFSLRSSPLG